jgi:hypothetical protein
MFPGVTPDAIKICPFYGVENEEEADSWIRRYELWATQEKLNRKQKLQLVLLALFDAAYIWARDLDLEKVKWVAFWHLFRERYVGDPTPWPGNKMKSYPPFKRSPNLHLLLLLAFVSIQNLIELCGIGLIHTYIHTHHMLN